MDIYPNRHSGIIPNNHHRCLTYPQNSWNERRRNGAMSTKMRSENGHDASSGISRRTVGGLAFVCPILHSTPGTGLQHEPLAIRELKLTLLVVVRAADISHGPRRHRIRSRWYSRIAGSDVGVYSGTWCMTCHERCLIAT